MAICQGGFIPNMAREGDQRARHTYTSLAHVRRRTPSLVSTECRPWQAKRDKHLTTASARTSPGGNQDEENGKRGQDGESG